LSMMDIVYDIVYDIVIVYKMMETVNIKQEIIPEI